MSQSSSLWFSKHLKNTCGCNHCASGFTPILINIQSIIAIQSVAHFLAAQVNTDTIELNLDFWLSAVLISKIFERVHCSAFFFPENAILSQLRLLCSFSSWSLFDTEGSVNHCSSFLFDS